jgi:hypothetical protein
MRCFFKHGKLIRQIVAEPINGNEIKYMEGRYIFDEGSTFMYELDPRRNAYSPCAFWSAGNPKAHDFAGKNAGIPAGVLNEILSPKLLRVWVRAHEQPYFIALIIMGVIGYILHFATLYKVW